MNKQNKLIIGIISAICLWIGIIGIFCKSDKYKDYKICTLRSYEPYALTIGGIIGIGVVIFFSRREIMDKAAAAYGSALAYKESGDY